LLKGTRPTIQNLASQLEIEVAPHMANFLLGSARVVGSLRRDLHVLCNFTSVTSVTHF
jgi:predicted translin family RNA/ssDNA-binding protein